MAAADQCSDHWSTCFGKNKRVWHICANCNLMPQHKVTRTQHLCAVCFYDQWNDPTRMTTTGPPCTAEACLAVVRDERAHQTAQRRALADNANLIGQNWPQAPDRDPHRPAPAPLSNSDEEASTAPATAQESWGQAALRLGAGPQEPWVQSAPPPFAVPEVRAPPPTPPVFTQEARLQRLEAEIAELKTRIDMLTVMLQSATQ